MNYKQKILDDFNADLSATAYKDYPSVVQNAKTDILCEDYDISFDDWFDQLIDIYCRSNSVDAEELKKAIEAEPQFKEDMKSEFDDIKEVIEEDEDFDDDED